MPEPITNYMRVYNELNDYWIEIEILKLQFIRGLTAKISNPDEAFLKLAEWPSINRVTDTCCGYYNLCIALLENYTSSTIDMGSSTVMHELAGWVSDFVHQVWEKEKQEQVEYKRKKIKKLQKEVEDLQKEIEKSRH